MIGLRKEKLQTNSTIKKFGQSGGSGFDYHLMPTTVKGSSIYDVTVVRGEGVKNFVTAVLRP